MNRRGGIVLAVTLAAGCSHLQRTDRLDEARAAYEKAREGPAAGSSPADLATAKKFLDLAQAGLDTNDPKLVDDRATVALLKIEAAEALGRTRALAAERDRTLQALSIDRQQLLDQAQQRLAEAQLELERERVARDAAEARLGVAREAVARETQIRDLPQGTVITLPGGQLFEPGRADLLPAARERLARVAEFLKTARRSARVEGQPGTRGSRAVARALSGKRAERIRDFLIGEGVTSDQIRADPPARHPPPVAVASSPEFAANGAVNIILEPSATGTGGSSPRSTPR